MVNRSTGVVLTETRLLDPCRFDHPRPNPKRDRYQSKLPLKAKDWNRLKFTVAGDTIKLALNGVEIYERAIEPTNQRLFGLFHYVDKSEARVRNVTLTGQWSKTVPATAQLFEMKPR